MHKCILGDPGAASLFEEPLETYFPEIFEFVPLIGQVQPGNFVDFLHDVVFFFDWRVPSEDSRGEFQKKMQRSRGNRKP